MTSQEPGPNDKPDDKSEFSSSLPEEIELKNFIGYANRLQAAIKVWKNKAKEAVNNARWLGEEVVRLEERCEAADGEIAYIRNALKEILDSEPSDLKHRRAKHLASATSKRPSSITYSSASDPLRNVKPELAQHPDEASSDIAAEKPKEGSGETSRATTDAVDQSGGLSALRQNYRESTPDAHGQERQNEQVAAAAQVNGVVRRGPIITAPPEQQKPVYFGPEIPSKEPYNSVVKGAEEEAANAAAGGEASSDNQKTSSRSRSRTSNRLHNSNVKSEMRGRPMQHDVAKRKLEVRTEGQSKRRRLTTTSEVAADKEQQQHDKQPEEDLLGALKKSNDDGRSDVYTENLKEEDNVTVQSAQQISQGWTMKIESDVQMKRDDNLSPQQSLPLRSILKVGGRERKNPPPPLPPSATKNQGKFGDGTNRRSSLTLQPPPPPLIKPSPPSPANARPSSFIGPVIPMDLKKQQSVPIVAKPKLTISSKTTSMGPNSASEAKNSQNAVPASPSGTPYGANIQAQHPSVVVQQPQPQMTSNPTEVIMTQQAYPIIASQYPAANSSPQLQTVYFQLPNQPVPVPGPPLPHQGVPLPPPNHHQGNLNNGMNNEVAPPPPGSFNNNVQQNNFNGPSPANFNGGQQGGFSNQPAGPQRPGSGQPGWIGDYSKRVAKIENIFKNRFVCYSFCINGRCSCQFANPQAHPQELAGRFGPSFDDQPALPPDVVHRIWTQLPERFKKTIPGGAQREYKCRICRGSFIGYFNFNTHLNESGHRN